MSLWRKSYADTPAGQVHLRRVEGAGPPLVLLHRTPVSSACYEPVLARLAGRRAAIALDTPGFGASFLPTGAPAAADYGRHLLAALDALQVESFHLFGHHTGTHFAAEMARQAPDRVLSLGLSGVMYASAEERAAMRAEIGEAPPIDAAGAYLGSTWALIKNFFPSFAPELVQSEFLGAVAAPVARGQAFSAILAQDFPSLLARIAQPVAIVQAKDDPLLGFLDRLRAAHPDIPIDMLGPAGIAAPELQPDDLADWLMAFAARHDPGSLFQRNSI